MKSVKLENDLSVRKLKNEININTSLAIDALTKKESEARNELENILKTDIESFRLKSERSQDKLKSDVELLGRKFKNQTKNIDEINIITSLAIDALTKKESEARNSK